MSSQSDQDDIGKLLQAAGPRTEPGADVQNRVYQAVLEEWECENVATRSQKSIICRNAVKLNILQSFNLTDFHGHKNYLI